jgi:hypothetical protein
MGRGQEMMQQLQEVLAEFEEAVKRREHKGLLESKVALQQDVDKARDRVVEVVVALVRAGNRANKA